MTTPLFSDGVVDYRPLNWGGGQSFYFVINQRAHIHDLVTAIINIIVVFYIFQNRLE